MSTICKSVLILAGLAGSAGLAVAAAPEGWYLAGTKAANYDTGVDHEAIYNGRPSAYMKAKADEEGFGTLMQDISAAQYVGKRVRFSGFVKSDSVTRWAGLWMRVDGAPGTTLAFDNMQDRAVKGTTGWQQYAVVLDVPESATGIFFGILLDGPGEVWLNNANIEVVGADVPATGRSARAVPDGPRNLKFDQ